jgi:hypothetical protein
MKTDYGRLGNFIRDFQTIISTILGGISFYAIYRENKKSLEIKRLSNEIIAAFYMHQAEINEFKVNPKFKRFLMTPDVKFNEKLYKDFLEEKDIYFSRYLGHLHFLGSKLGELERHTSYNLKLSHLERTDNEDKYEEICNCNCKACMKPKEDDILNLIVNKKIKNGTSISTDKKETKDM